MDTPTTRQKALALNLDGRTYGAFAEIGGGQEVVRAFFAAGGAAGTLAKAVSAHGLAGRASRCGAAEALGRRERLQAVLPPPGLPLVEPPRGERGGGKCFLPLADTLP